MSIQYGSLSTPLLRYIGLRSPLLPRISKAKPNTAHCTLALLSLPTVRTHYGLALSDAKFSLITQNIDELSTRVLDDLLSSQGNLPPPLPSGNVKIQDPEIDAAKRDILEMHGCVWDLLCTNFQCQFRARNYDVPICIALGQDLNSSDKPADDQAYTASEVNPAGPAVVPGHDQLHSATNNDSEPADSGANSAARPSPLAALHAALRSPPTLRKTGLLPPPAPPRIPDSELPRCPKCGALARPGEVWFGEAARHMDEIFKKVEEADLCLVIGTSATVRTIH